VLTYKAKQLGKDEIRKLDALQLWWWLEATIGLAVGGTKQTQHP
jgi:hypothetical protein